MDRDMLALLGHYRTATRQNEIRRERNERHSLSLDTVMDGRPRASNSQLLQLPAEILAGVVDLLFDDYETLASLALVNSDCRQLARCAQFADIQFDYSARKEMLFKAIGLQGTAASAARPPGIGSCVRRVTFTSHPQRVEAFHKDLYASFFGKNKLSYAPEERSRLLVEANQRYVQSRKLVMHAITTAMPNLNAVVWEDAKSIDRDFLSSLSRSPAQHARFDRVTVGDMSCLEQPLPVAAWPLRSLEMGLSPKNTLFEVVSDETMSTFYKNFLRPCAPTLESLDWSLTVFPRQTVSLGSPPLLFPRLQRLRLAFVHLDAPTLSSFLASPLRQLELPYTYLHHCIAALDGCAPLRDLASFVVDQLPLEEELCMPIARFLKRHTHLQKLYVHEVRDARGATAQLDRCIMPVLANNTFANLGSLSLTWGGGGRDQGHVVHASDEGLAAVGTLVSLEQLYLSCGITSEWRCQWVVDHAQLRRHLRRLVRLRTLALVRDTYEQSCLMQWDEPRIELYYQYRVPRAIDYTEAHARTELDVKARADASPTRLASEEIWERAHRNRMLTHVEAYAAVLPALEWMYCGQRPMGVERDPRNAGGPCKAVPLTAERDDCYPFEGIFGMCTN